MKNRLRNLSYKTLLQIFKYILTISVIFSLVIGFFITYEHNGSNRATLIFMYDGIILAILIFVLYSQRFLSSLVAEILKIDVDLEKYRNIFAYGYRKAHLWQKASFLQQSYIADGQYHFFKGDFSAAQQSFSEVNLKKVLFNLRKQSTESLLYYRLLNQLHQGKFEQAETALAEFRALKGTAEKADKLVAIQAVLTGKPTDYFSQTTFKTRLDQISAHYYNGRNYLNQGKTEEAKADFQAIVHENPDLFYVREAQKYVEELT